MPPTVDEESMGIELKLFEICFKLINQIHWDQKPFQGSTDFNNIIVTGTHTVYHPIRGWILISEHEDSKKIQNYDDPFCYCINTSSKRIYIKDYSFLDWDDIKYTDFLNLKKQTGIKKMSDISLLDKGYSGATVLNLRFGKKRMSEVMVNDILKNGEKVLGTVKTLGGVEGRAVRPGNNCFQQFANANIKWSSSLNSRVGSCPVSHQTAG